MKTPKATFYEGPDDNEFLFLFLKITTVCKNLAPGIFAYVLQIRTGWHPCSVLDFKQITVKHADSTSDFTRLPGGKYKRKPN